MLSFVNDYSQGTHEAILNRLLQTNSETVPNGTAGQESGIWFWETLDEDHTAVRFVTSWATRPQDVEALREILMQEMQKKA